MLTLSDNGTLRREEVTLTVTGTAFAVPLAVGLDQRGEKIMLRAKINGLSVGYDQTGDGPALVWLHGFTIDSRMWRPQLESLSDEFTVTAGRDPRPGVLSAPFRACVVACPGRYIRRLERFAPRSDRRGTPGSMPARCLATTRRARAGDPVVRERPPDAQKPH